MPSISFSTDLDTLIKGKVQMNAVNPTRIKFRGQDEPAHMIGSLAGSFVLSDGLTFIATIDNANDPVTVTFAATAGNDVGGGSPATDITALIAPAFKIAADGDATAHSVTLPVSGNNTGSKIAAAMQTAIRALGGAYADVTVQFTGGVYVITSGMQGTASQIRVTAGSSTGGTITVTVTAADMPNSQKNVLVALLASDDTPAKVGAKIRTALAADEDVGGFFTVGGSGANLSLTAKTKAANDTTADISITDDDGTAVTMSAATDSTPGVAPVKQKESMAVTHGATYTGTIIVEVTAAGMTGGSKNVDVPVTAGDSAVDVSGKIAAQFALDEDVNAFFTPTAESGNSVLEARTAADNDNTIAIALISNGDTGVTAGSSVHTNAGVAPVKQKETVSATHAASGAESATMTVRVTSSLLSGGFKDIGCPVTTGDDVNAVGSDLRAALIADADVGDPTTGHFTITGSNASAILEAKIAAANDTTLAVTLQDANGTEVTFGASQDTLSGSAGSAQIETLTLTAGANRDGTIILSVTAAGMSNSPKSVSVPVLATDNTAAKVMAKVRTAFGLDANISSFFNIGGSGADCALTAKIKAANDATMSISLINAGDTAVTANASQHTISGNAGTAQIEAASVTAGVSHDVSAALKIGAGNGAVDTDGTGDFENAAVATADEVVAAILAADIGCVVANSGEAVLLSTYNVGSLSSIVLGSGTANAALGFADSQTATGRTSLDADRNFADSEYYVSAQLEDNTDPDTSLSVCNKAQDGFEVYSKTPAATDGLSVLVAGRALT